MEEIWVWTIWIEVWVRGVFADEDLIQTREIGRLLLSADMLLRFHNKNIGT